MITERLDISFIAARLEALEETIISKLIDRAQFCVNDAAYETGKSGFFSDTSHSLFEIRIIQQEQMDARFGRFCVPEERPFTMELPEPQRVVNIPDTGLQLGDFNLISQSDRIISSYLKLVGQMCNHGDDGQYGSSVEHDVYAIQAIARRIHYGALYVSESKYLDDIPGYAQLIRNRDTGQLMERLTRKDVEDKIIDRIREKTKIAQLTVDKLIRNVIDPDIVAEFYQNVIIPLTKQGEIAYFLNRQNV